MANALNSAFKTSRQQHERHKRQSSRRRQNQVKSRWMLSSSPSSWVRQAAPATTMLSLQQKKNASNTTRTLTMTKSKQHFSTRAAKRVTKPTRWAGAGTAKRGERGIERGLARQWQQQRQSPKTKDKQNKHINRKCFRPQLRLPTTGPYIDSYTDSSTYRLYRPLQQPLPCLHFPLSHVSAAAAALDGADKFTVYADFGSAFSSALAFPCLPPTPEVHIKRF